MKLLGFLSLFVVVSCQPLQDAGTEDKTFWRKVGSDTLDTILNRKEETGIAKNVIVFVGDGMGIPTVTMARIYQGQLNKMPGERNQLTFEKFPFVGFSKTYDASHQVADSASTATAIFSGVKTTQATIGLDTGAKYDDCVADGNAKAKTLGMMTWAQENGKDTGIVTTARVTHATPAGTYAHINNRDWECDSAIPTEHSTCVKDIARQMVEDAPGKNFKVILGGGRKQLGAESDGETNDTSCKREDGLNLVDTWKKDKTNAEYVTTAKDLNALDLSKVDYLLGLFAPGHMSYVAEKEETRPSLKTLTETAIKMLRKNSEGYVLMVEGARIDMAHHDNYAKLALIEAVEFDEAVAAAVAMTDPTDTLIIVTADHSHAAIMNGYPKRNNEILGLAEDSTALFYETITYSNGPGYEHHHPTDETVVSSCSPDCSEIEDRAMSSMRDIRKEPDRENDVFYRHFSGHYRKLASHGGEDVGVFALGPKAHLLVGVYEQNYIGTVISYAACMGPEAHRCKSAPSSSTSLFTHSTLGLLIYALLPRIFIL
ncbi:hypothetical protein RUM43_011981 [Polyplax serrata]|uniref:Alkaline phosphatase n=1 Tax=Polyplax serrata TaxID=468196 RepID=A0AAN8PJ33_POLSC